MMFDCQLTSSDARQSVCCCDLAYLAISVVREYTAVKHLAFAVIVHDIDKEIFDGFRPHIFPLVEIQRSNHTFTLIRYFGGGAGGGEIWQCAF